MVLVLMLAFRVVSPEFLADHVHMFTLSINGTAVVMNLLATCAHHKLKIEEQATFDTTISAIAVRFVSGLGPLKTAIV